MRDYRKCTVNSIKFYNADEIKISHVFIIKKYLNLLKQKVAGDGFNGVKIYFKNDKQRINIENKIKGKLNELPNCEYLVAKSAIFIPEKTCLALINQDKEEQSQEARRQESISWEYRERVELRKNEEDAASKARARRFNIIFSGGSLIAADIISGLGH